MSTDAGETSVDSQCIRGWDSGLQTRVNVRVLMDQGSALLPPWGQQFGTLMCNCMSLSCFAYTLNGTRDTLLILLDQQLENSCADS